MYHVIIADDEQNALNELLYIINWQEHNFIIDAIAHDGDEAITLIENFNPDLVICDINMPKRTGNEVLSYINQNGLKALFVAVSAYSDFSYVQNCINNGGFSYLLKTIDKSELLNVLTKAKKIIDEKSSQTKENNYKSTLFSIMGNHDCILHLKDLGFECRFPLFTAIKTKLIFPARFEERSDCSIIFFPMEKASFIVINHREDYDLASNCIEFAPCGVSLTSQFFNKLYYEADCAMLSTNFFNCDIKYYRKSTLTNTKNAINQINNLTTESEIVSFINSNFQSINELCHLYNVFFDNNVNTMAYFDFANEFSTPKDFALFIINYNDLDNTTDVYETVSQIHTYIEQHYMDDLSISSLSKQFFISSSYLNKIFKKTYGVTINKYLTDIRMNKALELIKANNNLTMMKISQLVGYSDFYYFSRVFKKTFNVAPSYYDKSNNIEIDTENTLK